MVEAKLPYQLQRRFSLNKNLAFAIPKIQTRSKRRNEMIFGVRHEDSSSDLLGLG